MGHNSMHPRIATTCMTYVSRRWNVERRMYKIRPILRVLSWGTPTGPVGKRLTSMMTIIPIGAVILAMKCLPIGCASEIATTILTKAITAPGIGLAKTINMAYSLLRKFIYSVVPKSRI